MRSAMLWRFPTGSKAFDASRRRLAEQLSFFVDPDGRVEAITRDFWEPKTGSAGAWVASRTPFFGRVLGTEAGSGLSM